MLIGYARVSTQDQTLNSQVDELKKAGCEKIYSDVVTGSNFNRKGLSDALEHLREGDVLVVWRLDRLGRTLKQLIELINLLSDRKVGFRSINDAIDTTTSTGKFFFHVFGALSELERDIIRERTNIGLAAARSRGRTGGRPSALDEKGKKMLYELYDSRNTDGSKKYEIQDILDRMGIKSKGTLYRYLNERNEKNNEKRADAKGQN